MIGTVANAYLCLFASLAGAAAPEETYLASRDALIAKFKRLQDAADKSCKANPDLDKQQQQALKSLEQQTRAVVGPMSLKGFGAGKLSLDTLSEGDIDFSQLDGLRFSTKGGKSDALVATRGLFDAWLRANPECWTLPATPPKTLDEALVSQDFYTFSMSEDAVVNKYAEIPVAPPPGVTHAHAILDARSQDIAPRIPDEIIIGFLQGERLVIASAPVKAKIAAIAPCEKFQKEWEAKADAALKAYNETKPQNDKLFDDYTHLQAKGDIDYRACYGAHAKDEAFFIPVTTQAQALLDTLAAH
jgi:hypothetical protein